MDKKIIILITFIITAIIFNFYLLNKNSVLSYQNTKYMNQIRKLEAENNKIFNDNINLSQQLKLKIEEKYHLEQWANKVYCSIETGDYIITWGYIDSVGEYSGHISNIKFNSFTWSRPPMNNLDCR